MLLGSKPYVVRGGSMRPTFEPGQHLLVSRVAYSGSSPSRGDVVIVRDPRDGGRRILKRVVGLPGETVAVREGTLLVDGEALAELYLGGLPASLGMEEWACAIRDDEYVVLGDRRWRSTDSREFGPVRTELIVGRAWFRYWPPRTWGRVR